MNANLHHDRSLLWRVAAGKASPPEISDVQSHLQFCDSCVQDFDSLSHESEPPLVDSPNATHANALNETPHVDSGDLSLAVDSSERGSDLTSDPTFLDQIGFVCVAFANAWREGKKPRLEDFLKLAPADAHPALFINLLNIEIAARRVAGDVPQINEYTPQWSEYASEIRDLFLEPAPSAADDAASLDDAVNRERNGPMISRLGDYRILGELGRGGMGVVFEAVHQKRGNRVALKALPNLTGSLLHRFKREFRSVSKINHPNLIGLHTLETDGGQWFFTMDLIDGETFLQYVRPSGVLDVSRLRLALPQLVRGVMAIHAEHIFHRDLKPSNVMVNRDGQLVILDFGLVLEENHSGSMESITSIAGTPVYMAPEQAAGRDLTTASDWYSVGVMLYEALTGRPPFSGHMLKVLQDKQSNDVPLLPTSEAIPKDLAELCQRLLARDPKKRPNAFDITKAITSSLQVVAESTGPLAQQIVGRESQLASLREVLRTVEQQGEPQTVFISGRSGEGKSTLAEHFLAPLRKDKRFAVMSGRCYDRESVPFKALDALIDALGSYLRALPIEQAALLMPDDIGMLAQVFPVLQRVEVVAKASSTRLKNLDEQQIRQRAFRALRSLWERISRRSLIILFIDDLQWGDADSAQAMFEVLRPPEGPSVLFLSTYRSDETAGSAFLNKWKELLSQNVSSITDREIKVGPLTVEECTELVVGLIGTDSEKIRLRAVEFAKEARGNPFFLTELVGCFDPDTDSFELLPLNEVLENKLKRLPSEAVHLLEVVAISGQGLSLEEASDAAGHALIPMATITRMCNERLVRLIGAEENPTVDTYHDRVRETFLSTLGEERCKGLHRILAECIEKCEGAHATEWLATLEDDGVNNKDTTIPRVFDLAYHFDAAGGKRKAWQYALLAAEQARRQSALEVAENNYAIAGRNSEVASNSIRYRIVEGHAEALMQLGRSEDANRQLVGAIELVDDVERKARIESLQADIALRQGGISKSIVLTELALTRLGTWVPSSRVGLCIGIFKELLIHCGHTLFPKRLHRNPSNERLDLTIRVLNESTRAYFFQSSFRLAWNHFAGMNRAELRPASTRLAISYSIHSAVLSMLGWHSRSGRFGARALKIVTDFDDLMGLGWCCTFIGIGLYAAARYEDGHASTTEAIEAYTKTGEKYMSTMAQFHRACCRFGLGNLAEAVIDARETFTNAARVDDSRTFCSSYVWARATRGNIPFEQLQSCYPCRPDDVMSSVHGIMAEGHWHRFHGRTADSLKQFEQAVSIIWKSQCINSHMILAWPELATALRLHADTLETKDRTQCSQLRRRAFRIAKWSARIMRLFPAAYPLALRELSLNLLMKGKLAKALKVVDKSCSVAEKQKAKFEHAQSLLVRGRIAQKLGRPEGDEQVRTAEADMHKMESAIGREPWGVVRENS